MFFTQEDYRKIQDWLSRNSSKDSELLEATPLNGNEIISIVQANHNKKISIKDFVNQIFKVGSPDFFNVTDKLEAPYITLEEAINMLPTKAKKQGQVITFLNKEGNWDVYQFIGANNQCNIPDKWNNIFDIDKYIIDSLLPDEEDLTKTKPDAKGNSYVSLKDRAYNPSQFSGYGEKILRRHIIEVEVPGLGMVEKNILYQDVFDSPNTIYKVRYDFDLNGQTIELPENCILDFVGGSITNGTLVLNNTLVLPFGYIENDIIKCNVEGTYKEGQMFFNREDGYFLMWDGKEWISASTYFRWGPNNTIQISRNNKDWEDLSEPFSNSLYIKGYVNSTSNLPSGALLGDIYMVGTGAPYDMYVKTSEGWKNNGQYTSITAGIEQTTGQSTTNVMSQKAVTDKFTELESDFDKIGAEPSVNIWKGKRSYNFIDSLLIGEQGVKLYPSGTYTLSLIYVGEMASIEVIGYGSNGQIFGTRFPNKVRGNYSFTANSPIERLFFRASGDCNISDIQIEIGSAATTYTTPLAVTDFNAQERLSKIEGITNNALLYSEQNLTENQQKQARINIASFGYNGSLQPTSIDDKTLPTGFFYMNQGGNLPIKRAGLLFVYNYANVFIEQRLIDLVTNEEYVRSTGVSETWTNWHGAWENYSNYKGSLNADNNVDEILSEGVWYLSTTYKRPQGNLPNGIQYGLLVEDSVGGGLSVQTITDLLSSERYTRVFKDAWSEWRLESDRLKELLNLLPNTQGTQTINGITFDVQNDGTIKVFGTKTSGNSIYLIASVTLEKGYYWLGGCPNANTSISMRVIRGDGSYKDMYLNNGDQYRIEVTEDVETISVYLFANTSIAESSPYIFRPMLCRIGSPTTNYQQYGIYKDWGKANSYISHSNFSWVGKKMVVKGDSIAEGRGGCFANVVGQILRLSDVHNFGIGGSRMAYYGDGQNVTADMSVVATWDEMERDADIVYIHAGTNDWASQVPLGEPTSTNKMEFNGALNIIMSGLRAKYPTSLIIFDTILPRVNYDADNNSGVPTPIKTSAYSQAIKDRCADHHIVCNDVFESCGLDFEYDYNNSVYATTADGLHPNIKGAEILGRKIAGFINSH